VRIAAEFLLSVTTVPLNQNQFDALVDFIFNVGQANYATSTLKRKLNAGQYQAAAREFDRWVFAKVNGKPEKLPGLVKRRAADRKLFETPVHA
jgi:lysozyme